MPTEPEQQLASWVEWKERCALDLCADPAQQALRKFAEERFHGFLRKYAFRTNSADAASGIGRQSDCWHLFETYLLLKASREGKRYKDWLFARAESAGDPLLDVIQGGATLLMRDVVREFLRKEYSPSDMISINQRGLGSDTSITLEDLLPGGVDPAGEVERREFEKLAVKHATVFLAEMSNRERVGFLARAIRISLSHPVVQQAAGCGKSMVNAAYQDAVRRVCSRLRTDYPDDDREAVLLLAGFVLNEMNRGIVAWAKSEKACAPLFLLSGEASDPSFPSD